jgi:hypothetical protein
MDLHLGYIDTNLEDRDHLIEDAWSGADIQLVSSGKWSALSLIAPRIRILTHECGDSRHHLLIQQHSSAALHTNFGRQSRPDVKAPATTSEILEFVIKDERRINLKKKTFRLLPYQRRFGIN